MHLNIITTLDCILAMRFAIELWSCFGFFCGFFGVWFLGVFVCVLLWFCFVVFFFLWFYVFGFLGISTHPICIFLFSNLSLSAQKLL